MDDREKIHERMKTWQRAHAIRPKLGIKTTEWDEKQDRAHYNPDYMNEEENMWKVMSMEYNRLWWNGVRKWRAEVFMPSERQLISMARETYQQRHFKKIAKEKSEGKTKRAEELELKRKERELEKQRERERLRARFEEIYYRGKPPEFIQKVKDERVRRVQARDEMWKEINKIKDEIYQKIANRGMEK